MKKKLSPTMDKICGGTILFIFVIFPLIATRC
jgi:hypothetical protein